MLLQANADLSHRNTLGLPATAQWLAAIDDDTKLAAALEAANSMGLRRQVLGGGSNLWLPPCVGGLTLHVRLQGRALVDEDDDAWYVAAAGGENWHEFVQWTLAQGWAGLENLALIPGTVGAAPVQNIGAYGVELKDVCHRITALSLDNASARHFSPAEAQFAYRDSVFKQAEGGRWLISEVVFRLPKHWQPKLQYGDIATKLAGSTITPQAVADTVMAIRRSKLPDPHELGNAGSFFHNPIVSDEQAAALRQQYPALVSYPQAHGQHKLAAGWLIEQAGWKGKRLGPVGMYAKQALVLVNHGGANSADVAAIVAQIQHDVLQAFGVSLTPEPIRWGE